MSRRSAIASSDLRGGARGDVGALRQLGADGQEDGVEATLELFGEHVADVAPELELDAQVGDPLDLGVEHIARQSVLGDPVAHHPAGARRHVADRHVVSEQRQVVGGREPDGPRADDEHALAGPGYARADVPAGC